MTTPHPDVSHDGSALAPPPGCPAHGVSAEGIRRLYGPDAEANPQGLYEELRGQYGPVAPVLLHGGADVEVPAWLVLGYPENLDVMRTPSRFSRDSRRWNQWDRVPADSPLNPMVGWQPLCVFADGEEHERLRGAVTAGLEQFNRHGVRRYVKRYTEQLVDSFAAKGEADLIRDYAEKLPMMVVTRLLGMAPGESPDLVEPTLDLMKGTGTAAASNDLVTRTLAELVERKKKNPGRDLASSLIGHDPKLTDNEIIEHLRLTLVAAHQGTVNLIAHTLRLMLTDPRFRGSLSGGQMTLPDALEQVMWDNPSIAVVPGRWATGNTTLGEQHINKGDLLLLGIAAANVDPAIRPNLSAPVHGNRSHLAFSSGPHECPGADIGRAIADTGIDTLMGLLPGLELAVPATELTLDAAWLTQRPASLPVKFPPRHGDGQSTGEVSQPLPPSVPVDSPSSGPATAVAPGRRSWWRWLLHR
ncbi:cytochrome [Streptomyces lunaelactis]|uniref:Cytochrome n=1 Tax=Streptomyces lunaelactis TaxID=1535768 RepID=A0A2R4SVU7_9ACTN|nr:cytochrome P450 [Streptomyces lunaelactis]AVZ70974.1 cytochrome [Streptomyces lunaelactis]NUK27501.1 cytochrome P450 [Streptomyces lunaelactis]NUK85961.1 cytochrome P450 [Streptomyces lunaelactis]